GYQRRALPMQASAPPWGGRLSSALACRLPGLAPPAKPVPAGRPALQPVRYQSLQGYEPWTRPQKAARHNACPPAACHPPRPTPTARSRHEGARTWRPDPWLQQPRPDHLWKDVYAGKQAGYSCSDVLVAQHPALQVFKYDLVDQGGQYGNGQDIGHH